MAEARPGVADIEMRVAHPHVDPAAAEFSRLGSFEDRIGRVLYDFEDLSVAIAAREHGLLDIEMLFNEIRLDLVYIQELSATCFNIRNKRCVR